MLDYSQYFTNYTCPKCRGRSCTTSVTTLGGWTRHLFSRPRDNQYLMVTCALCGYSELYSLKVLASTPSVVPAKKTTPIVENVE